MEIALVKAKTRIVFFILVVPSVLFLFRQLGAPEKEKGANLIAPSLRHREAPCRECAKPRRCGARFGNGLDSRKFAVFRETRSRSYADWIF